MTQAHEWTAADAAGMVRAPGPHSHKYNRGVLGLRTGSSAYPGAAVLGAEAAWRTGIGLVCFFAQVGDDRPAFGLPSPAAAVLARRPETVFAHDSAVDRARCDAWVIGSGTNARSRSLAETAALTEILTGDSPVVIDAGALDLVSTGPVAAPAVVTPHLGEFRLLCESAGIEDVGGTDVEQTDAALALADRTGVTVLLKGSRTICASPGGSVYVTGPATPWLATAGTGDVLAGILGTLLAGHSSEIHHDDELLVKLGATAAVLHDQAARIALGDHTEARPGPITALDVADALPRVISSLIS